MSYFGVSLRNGVGIGLGNTAAVNTSTISGGPSLVLDFLNNTLDSRITFTRSTTATYTDSSGAIATAAVNVPRFDYNPVTLAPKGLLIEEQRTNLLLNSAVLSLQTVTTAATAYTLSFYGTGTIVLSGTYSATVVGNGAYPTRTTLTFTPTAGALVLTITGSVQNAQLEAGSFATSYIPTTIAQVTRTADAASMTGTNFSSWYNANEGTFFIDASWGTPTTTPPANGRSLFTVNNSASVTVLHTLYNGAGQAVFRSTNDAGVGQTFLSYSSGAAIINSKFGCAYKINDYAFIASGQTIQTSSTAAVPTTVNQLLIGSQGSPFEYAYIKNIIYYPRRLTNQELRVITS